jgi:AAR2 protein
MQIERSVGEDRQQQQPQEQQQQQQPQEQQQQQPQEQQQQQQQHDAQQTCPQLAHNKPQQVAPPPRQPGGRCRYTQLQRVAKPHGASAAELTAANMDKTGLLEAAMARYHDAAPTTAPSTSTSCSAASGSTVAPHGIDVVGELQFAFIAFVIGQSLDGEQMCCNCSALLLLLFVCLWRCM